MRYHCGADASVGRRSALRIQPTTVMPQSSANCWTSSKPAPAWRGSRALFGSASRSSKRLTGSPHSIYANESLYWRERQRLCERRVTLVRIPPVPGRGRVSLSGQSRSKIHLYQRCSRTIRLRRLGRSLVEEDSRHPAIACA